MHNRFKIKKKRNNKQNDSSFTRTRKSREFPISNTLDNIFQTIHFGAPLIHRVCRYRVLFIFFPNQTTPSLRRTMESHRPATTARSVPVLEPKSMCRYLPTRTNFTAGKTRTGGGGGKQNGVTFLPKRKRATHVVI